MILTTTTEEQTISLGKKIGLFLKDGDVIALQGTLAAGKTTLTKGIALGLDIEEPVTSPTFTLISEYEGRLHLYHMDAYRLDCAEAFIDLGVEDYLGERGVCIIEWSERVMEELPSTTILIYIEHTDGENRTITITNWPYGELSI